MKKKCRKHDWLIIIEEFKWCRNCGVLGLMTSKTPVFKRRKVEYKITWEYIKPKNLK